MTIDFRYKTGDLGPQLRYRVTDFEGDLVDLHTGTLAASTARLLMRKPDRTVLNPLLTIEGAASASYVNYTLTASTFDVAGWYTFETEITWSDATKTTYPETGYNTVRVDPGLG